MFVFPQGESGKSDFPMFDLDVEKISDGSLEPSILSMFQEKSSAGEVFHVMVVFGVFRH